MISRVCLVVVLALVCLIGGSAGSEVPTRVDRTIATVSFDYGSKLTPEQTRDLAQRFDHLIVTDILGHYIPQLRSFNPKIKVYLYESGLTVADGRDSNGNDQYYGNCVFGLGYVFKNHPEWLYSVGDSFAHEDNRYFIKATNTGYQKAWADRVVELTKRYGFDGVFMDDTEAIGPEKIPGGRKSAEVQAFLHAVLPKLRAAGLNVILNACGQQISSGNVQSYFAPAWTPPTTLASQDYRPNSADQVPNAQFQEWAFFRPGSFAGSSGNGYERNYWLGCLRDMDAAPKWKTVIHEQVYGADKPADPAKGVNGWLNFGLCSYLLGFNSYTTLAMRVMRGEAVDPDFALIRKLGDPVGEHKAVSSNEFLRYRVFKANENGGVGGLVVVNAYERESRAITTPIDVVSQDGESFSKGQKIILPPHTGRVLLRK